MALDRDSADSAVVRAVRRVLLRIHPDTGGNLADIQRLNDMKDKWEGVGGVGQERASAPAKGRGWRRGEGRGEGRERISSVPFTRSTEPGDERPVW